MNNRDELTALVERAEGQSELAKQEVIGLAKGTRKWTMCIPVNPTDSDTLLMNTFRTMDELVAALKSCLARVDELEKLALANMAQQSQDLGLYEDPGFYDVWPEDKDE